MPLGVKWAVWQKILPCQPSDQDYVGLLDSLAKFRYVLQWRYPPYIEPRKVSVMLGQFPITLAFPKRIPHCHEKWGFDLSSRWYWNLICRTGSAWCVRILYSTIFLLVLSRNSIPPPVQKYKRDWDVLEKLEGWLISCCDILRLDEVWQLLGSRCE